jgi:hypothetical protein
MRESTARVPFSIDDSDDRTLLKLNAYYAFPALSNGEPQEPYTSTCLASIREIVSLVNTAREVGFAMSSSPLLIWASWVGARVDFGMSPVSRGLAAYTDISPCLSIWKAPSG